MPVGLTQTSPSLLSHCWNGPFHCKAQPLHSWTPPMQPCWNRFPCSHTCNGWNKLHKPLHQQRRPFPSLVLWFVFWFDIGEWRETMWIELWLPVHLFLITMGAAASTSQKTKQQKKSRTEKQPSPLQKQNARAGSRFHKEEKENGPVHALHRPKQGTNQPQRKSTRSASDGWAVDWDFAKSQSTDF